MSVLGKVALGAAQGLGKYLTQQGEQELKLELAERQADILERRQRILEGLRHRNTMTEKQQEHSYAIAKDNNNATLNRARQEAAELGLTEDTEEWREYLRDRTLGAHGPTAVRVTERGQDITERNNVRSTSVSERNNVRSTNQSDRNSQRSAETARENRGNTPAAQVLNGKGEVTLVYPDNRVTTLRDSKPIGGKKTVRPAAPDGTIISGPGGKKMIKRGGQWAPYP